MKENKKKKIYIEPQAVPVKFRVSDIVITSGTEVEEEVVDNSAKSFFMNLDTRFNL